MLKLKCHNLIYSTTETTRILIASKNVHENTLKVHQQKKDA